MTYGSRGGRFRRCVLLAQTVHTPLAMSSFSQHGADPTANPGASGAVNGDRLPAKAWNRSQGTRRLEQEITRAQREPGYSFSVLLVELDGLSDTSDRLGYAAEEDAWRRAGAFLSQHVGPDDFCCRLSGDEFLLILSGHSLAEASAVEQRLRQSWKPAPRSRQSNVRIGVGVASYPQHGCSVEQLLVAADETLHADRVRNEMVRAADEQRQRDLSRGH